MGTVLAAVCSKRTFICLIAVLIALTALANPADAMFLPAAPRSQTDSILDREADLARIQAALESRIVQQRLVDHGLSPEDALAKMSGLSDAQIHQFAAQMDALQAGGRGSDNIIIILLLVLLIIIVV